MNAWVILKDDSINEDSSLQVRRQHSSEDIAENVDSPILKLEKDLEFTGEMARDGPAEEENILFFLTQKKILWI